MAVDAQLGRASVELRATLDKLDGDLSKARGRVDSAVVRMTRVAGKRFQQLGQVALGGISVATGAVAGLATALTSVAIDAAPVEGIASAFEGLAESADYGADEMLDALQRGSAGMVSQRDLMLSFNKAAGLVSTDFATQLPDAMSYLGKVSAATGEDMNYLLDSLVVGVGRMSPMILDNLGIQVSLAEATERAAQMYGMEADALDKSQVQAGMMNVVLEKLAANTADMPDVTETAAAKMAQFQASIQDAKDAIGLAFLPVLSGLLEAFAPLIDTALPVIVDLVSRLTEVLSPVIEALGLFISQITSGTDPMTAFKILLLQVVPPEMYDKIMQIVEGVRSFLEQIRPVVEKVTAWVGENVKLQDVLIALGAAIASVVLPALGAILGPVLGVIGVFAAAMAIVVALRKAWEEDFLGIRTLVQTTLNSIRGWWQEHRDTIISTAEQIWARVVAVFEFFRGQFETLFEAFSLAFEGDWRGFGEKLREYWDEAWEKISKIGEETWDAIVKFFSETDWAQVGKDIIQGIVDGLRAADQWLMAAARDAAAAAVDAAKGFLGIDSPSKRARDEIGEPWSMGAAQGMLDAIPQIQRAAQSATQAMMDASTSALPWGERVARGGGQDGGPGAVRQINIYGLTLTGVQDREGLLAELQALA